MVDVKSFFDPETATFTYVVSNADSLEALVIDPVLNYDQYAGKVITTSADEIIDYVSSRRLVVRWLLETHIHADHLTASSYIKQHLGGVIAIGSKIKAVLEHWIPMLNIGHDTPSDASQFDLLLEDGASIKLGNIDINVIHTPGHTPSCTTYVIGDKAFVGDVLFMPDVGTGRTDFPGGSASSQYDSIMRILALPDDTKIYCGHDYPPPERAASGLSRVKEQKENNILLKGSKSRQDYVVLRNQRDIGKPVPNLLFPSLQVNLRAGTFGQVESNGCHYIKIPVS